MNLRYAAAILCVLQALICLVIQPGIPLMGDITGEDDGGIWQGLAFAIPGALLALGFAIATRAAWLFLAWNAIWLVLWTIYSSYHLERWGLEGAGRWWLLVPELFVALNAMALVLGLFAVVLPRFATPRTDSPT
jgi:hypothetical protein